MSFLVVVAQRPTGDLGGSLLTALGIAGINRRRRLQWNNVGIRKTALRLELENDTAVDDPAPEAIAQALGSLGAKGNSYAILATEEELTYIQAAGSPTAGFVLEYQERSGSKTRHYQGLNCSLPLQKVVAAFQDFAAGGTVWKSHFQWAEMDAKRGCFGVLLLAAAAISGAALLR